MAESKELDQVKEAVGAGKDRHLRPSECRSHMRRTLANEFQGIVDGFVEAAKKGSCPHVKLATELLKPIRKNPSRKKGSITKILEELDRQKREKAELQAEQFGAK
jgi:predicted component of type VI protein secretion system